MPRIAKTANALIDDVHGLSGEILLHVDTDLERRAWHRW